MRAESRLARLERELEPAKLDAILVSHLPNIQYLCGFTGSAGLLVVGEQDPIFFTDGRYTVQAREEVKGARIRIEKGKSALGSATEWLRKQSRIKRLGIEAAYMTVSDRDTVAKAVGRAVRLLSAPSIIERMRMVKSPAEVMKIREACALGSHLLDTVRR